MCHYYNFNRNVALANTFGMSLEDSSGRSSTTSVTFGTVPTTTTASVSAVTASTTDGSTGAVVPVGTVPNPAMPVLPPAMPALPEATPTVPQATPALPAAIPPVAAPLVSVEESNLVESVQEGIAAQIQETEDVEELEADDVREEEIRPAVGSGYIYDDETLREILADRHGEQRTIIEGKKLEMMGETVSVTGQVWSVTETYYHKILVLNFLTRILKTLPKLAYDAILHYQDDFARTMKYMLETDPLQGTPL